MPGGQLEHGIMAQYLFAAFSLKQSAAEGLTDADAAVALMVRVVKPLGELITALPAGPEYPGRTAGPSFELFYESDYLLPHRDAAWVLLAERIDEAAVFCESASPELTALVPVREALHEIARSLTAHIPGRQTVIPAGPAAEAAQPTA